MNAAAILRSISTSTSRYEERVDGVMVAEFVDEAEALDRLHRAAPERAELPGVDEAVGVAGTTNDP